MRLQPPCAAFAAWARRVGFIGFLSDFMTDTMPAPYPDAKHTNPVKLWLTDREFLDLSRLADAADRKTSEMGRVIVRKYMYGNVGAEQLDVNRAISADQSRAD